MNWKKARRRRLPMKRIKNYMLLFLFCLSLCGCTMPENLGQNVQDIFKINSYRLLGGNI